MSGLAERWRNLDQTRIDRAVAVILALFVIPLAIDSPHREGPIVLNVLLAMIPPGALIIRRSNPLACVTIGSAAFLTLTLFLTPAFDIPPTTISLMIGSYSLGAHLERRPALLGLVVVASAILTTCLLETPEDILFPTIIFGIAPWAVGRVLRGHTALVRELGEKEVMLRHLRERERESAVIQERSRVAREIHDVLAHNLSVMVIQASGARRMVASNSDAAVEAAQLIERTGREALIELRQVFGTVRRGEAEALDGSPGLRQLPAMIERARKAGVPAELETTGDVLELSPGADAAAYRLVQEGLTNIYKHAGTASTSVGLDYRPDRLEIVIVNDDDGYRLADGPLDSGGQGLVGMRERMALYGGEMEAGPRAEGGFEVKARLPIGARDRERRTA